MLRKADDAQAPRTDERGPVQSDEAGRLQCLFLRHREDDLRTGRCRYELPVHLLPHQWIRYSRNGAPQIHRVMGLPHLIARTGAIPSYYSDVRASPSAFQIGAPAALVPKTSIVKAPSLPGIVGPTGLPGESPVARVAGQTETIHLDLPIPCEPFDGLLALPLGDHGRIPGPMQDKARRRREVPDCVLRACIQCRQRDGGENQRKGKNLKADVFMIIGFMVL